MKMRNYAFDSEIGKITLYEAEGGICGVDLEGKTAPAMQKKLFREAEFEEMKTDLLEKAQRELDEYFAGKRKEFDLPLRMYGTEFQKHVWNTLLQIPYGGTLTYGEVAQIIGNPKACRAVGMANNQNPLMILVPCHRVIGADGGLVGYGGGLDIKEKLLRLERKHAEQP